MKLDQLTFTRFIAAIAIVIFHFGYGIFPFDSVAAANVAKRLDIGVSYFFILSGFIMIVAYGQFSTINTLDFFKNRFARIYPLLILSVLPLFVGALLGFGNNNILDSILNVLCIQAWIPGKAIVGNGPAWSLSVEVFFYICFPFFYNRIFKKYSFKMLCLLILSFWAASVFFQNFLLSALEGNSSNALRDFIFYFPIMHLNQFLMGNLAGLYYTQKISQTDTRNYDIFILLTICLLIYLLLYPLEVNYHNGFLAVVFIPLIILFSLNNGLLTKFLKQKIFVFLGEISYGIYILQYPVYKTTEIIFDKLGIFHNATSRFYIYLLLLLMSSALSHIYIEKPMRNRIKTIRLSTR